MSATIFWEPVKERHASLNVGAPSWFRETMEQTFGAFPLELGSADLQTLRGMATVIRQQKPNPFEDLIDIIEKYERIKIWAEY